MKTLKSLSLWLILTIVTITAIGLWWRVDRYVKRDWTTDETNQYLNTRGPFKPVWQVLNYAEMHAFPGDYVLTYPFLELISNKKLAAALPHLLSTLLGFWVLALLCYRHLSHPISWIITFGLFAIHSQLIYHSLELRPYSMLITLGLSSFYILESLLNPTIITTLTLRLCFWVILMLTIAYHPYGILMVGMLGLFCLIKNYRNPQFLQTQLKRWGFWLSLSTCGLWLWQYYNKGSEMTPMHNLILNNLDVFQFIPNPLVDPINFTKSVLTNLIGYKPAYILLALAIGRLVWIKQDRFILTGFFLLIMVLPILLLVSLAAKLGYWFVPRQYAWIMGIFPLWLGWCLDALLIQLFVRQPKSINPSAS